MKYLTKTLDNFLSAPILIVLAGVLVSAIEFAGKGTFFAETGLIHAIVAPFLVLIIWRIFSDYAYGDPILKGFLKIQLGFFLFLGFIHIYEYMGTLIWMLNDNVVELSVMASYFLWIIGLLVSFEFIFRKYNKKSLIMMLFLVLIIMGGVGMLIGANTLPKFAETLPSWLPSLMLVSSIAFGILSLYSLRRIVQIMPVFGQYSKYAIPAIILIIFATFSEYSESISALRQFGVSETQNLYISHFLIYTALTLLLIAYGKLKRPEGIYSEIV